MGIGGSIFLIVVGAIFAFALDVNLGWLDINVVGWVLMLAGVFGLILTLYWLRGRRRTVVRPAAPTAPTRSSGEQREVDRDVVAQRGHQRAGMEELVMTEDRWPRVRPA